MQVKTCMLFLVYCLYIFNLVQLNPWIVVNKLKQKNDNRFD